MAGERKNYISWNEYFMGIASLGVLKSRNFSSGACLTGVDHRILATGYQRIPISIQNKTNDPAFEVSALSSALYSFEGRRQEFEGSTLYLSNFPNCEESRQIAQARIKKVFYLTNDIDVQDRIISEKILSCANVEVIPYFDEKYSKKEYISFLKEFKEVLRMHIGKQSEGSLCDDEYFMSIAGLSALRTKDPSTQVGACIVDSHNRILSLGYNGAPYGMSDEILPWHSNGEITGNKIDVKDNYIVHAEINAFDNYRGNTSQLKNGKIYLIYSPCESCSKRISMAKLNEVIYLREYTKNGVSQKSLKWLEKVPTECHNYFIDHDFTKEECLLFLDDTMRVLKRNISRK